MTKKDTGTSQRAASNPPGTQFNVLQALEAARGLLTVAEVAELLRKSVTVIYRLAERSQIPCFRIGGEWRFDPSTLAFWLIKKDPTLAAAARHQANAA